MQRLAADVTQKVLNRLRSEGGLRDAIASPDSTAPELSDGQFLTSPLRPEVIEKNLSTQYPLVLVYCTRLMNRQAEKFRGFSGTAEVTVELRVTGERLDGLNEQLHLLTDGVADVLQASRGDWGEGVFYGGGYEVAFGPIRQGIRGFLQEAKVELSVGVSVG